MNTKVITQNVFWCIILFITIQLTAASADAQDTIRNVGTLFNTGYILQDKNGDSVIDYVNVRILFPRNPNEAEIACAANIAARLGYETSALNFDFAGYDSENRPFYDVPVILIAERNAVIGRSGVRISENLAPGQGQVVLIPANSFFRNGGALITGGDATGMIAAAEYLSGRYPAVWNPKGKLLQDVYQQLKTFLDQRAITDAVILPHTVVIDRDKPGPLKLGVRITVQTEEALSTAAAALEGTEPQKLAGEKLLQLSNLEFTDLHRIEIELVGPQTRKTINLTPQKPWQARQPQASPTASTPDFSLSQIFSINGIFRDTNQDLVPDNTTAYLALQGTTSPLGIINAAARIGLETAGMRLPFVLTRGETENPADIGLPIIYGTENYYTKKFKADKKLYGQTEKPDEGYIQFVQKAFGDKHSLIISGSDSVGLNAAAEYVSKRMPYLWDYGKGNVQLEDIETDVRRFFQIRESPGQTAFSLYKLKQWLNRSAGKNIEQISVELSLDKPQEELDAFIKNIVREQFPKAQTNVSLFKTDFGVGKIIFEEDVTIPWEVDEFHTVFRQEILPKLSAGVQGNIRVIVSESPAVRAQLKTEIEQELAKKNIPPGAVTIDVLCAYKQGYSWLYDVILPKIRGKNVGSIQITYHNLKDSKEVRWQQIESETRWLQEIYPIDAVLARELNIPDSLITFIPTYKKNPIYTVIVFDKTGKIILKDTFDPKYVIRPFFDLFPEYESVRVTTGWVSASINGKSIVDKRIITDPERFWDHLQQKTYAKIIDYVMDVQEGNPSSSNAPFFDEFRVELTLSEPNYRIGIDEEVISSLEALHEDVYFETLTLFTLIGNRYGAGSLSYPGRVLPYIQPSAEGKPGRAKIRFTGKERTQPRLKLTITEKGKEPEIQKYLLNEINVNAPVIRGISLTAGTQGLSCLSCEVQASDSLDRYEEFKTRSTESSIDRTFISAQMLGDMVLMLKSLQNAGLCEDALSYDRIGELLFRFTLTDSSTFSRTELLPQTKHPKITKNPSLSDDKYKYDGKRIVQWESPIGLQEADAIMSKLNTLPGVSVYYTKTSFLGNPVYVIDVLPPMECTYISQAKLNALKPTLFLSGRQHANEVSSTSHILRLAELLATDSTYISYLKQVNVVLHPITNPDGAELAVEMHKTNPDFMLHAGYLGSLGVDVESETSSLDPKYPESSVRRMIRETWLPDVYINMHGYPSHEWVQYFAGYSAWVRSRTGGQRSWWSPRGWFVPGFSWVEDKRNPEFKTAQFAILDSIAAAITGNPQVDAMNKRLYSRYQKYGKQDVENFREYFHNGVLVSASLKGGQLSGSGINSTRITYFSITTESPDETARGDWMKLVCEAGLAHSTAILKYLSGGVNKINRDASEYSQYITRSVYRTKPVVPKQAETEKKTGK